jgi:hypothetical protein
LPIGLAVCGQSWMPNLAASGVVVRDFPAEGFQFGDQGPRRRTCGYNHGRTAKRSAKTRVFWAETDNWPAVIVRRAMCRLVNGGPVNDRAIEGLPDDAWG